MDYKVLFGILAVIIGFVGYVPYFRDMYLGKTKPHAFSWLLWGVLSTIAFFAQISEGAGAGSWILGISGLICLIVFVIALFVGEKDIVFFDWLCLFLAFATMILWRLTDDTLLAVILLTITDAISFLPTLRKTYYKPYEETLIEYVLSVVKYIFSLFAIASFTFVNWLYPASLIFMNGFFVVMVSIRRKKLKPRVSQSRLL